MPDSGEARKNSVQQLGELYNVVIGIALSLAIYNTLAPEAPFPIKVELLPNFFSFLILVVPFYHGAVRHLYATYVESGGSRHVKSGGLLLDFFLLFIEGCLFVMMAVVIAKTQTLAWAAFALLVLDSVWGFVAWLALTGAKSQFAEKKWAAINIATAIVLGAILLLFKDKFEHDGLDMAIVIMGLLFLRTVVDYLLTWSFYFPSAEPAGTEG